MDINRIEKGWLNIKEEEIADMQVSFFQSCMIENLNHARHIENERLTFNSIFMALAAATLAFSSQIPNPLLAAIICTILSITGIVSIILTHRWDNAFDRHLDFAEECYLKLHNLLLSDFNNNVIGATNKELLTGAVLPYYCFKIRNPQDSNFLFRKTAKLRTRHLFSIFYWLIEIVLILSIIYFATRA